MKHKSAKFGKIGVLAGGPSSEREISIKSGKAVCKALSEESCEVLFLDIMDDAYDTIENSRIDVAFIALHGKFGEDGTIQKMLEELKIPYTGSGVEASRLALDKIASREVFLRRNIPVPEYIVFERDSFKMSEAENLELPIVVKPQLEGSSIGLSIVRRWEELKSALERAFEYGNRILLEEYITGREVTVGVLEGVALPVVEIVTKYRVYDYDAKYRDSATHYLVPAPIEPATYEKARKFGVLAHNALGCTAYSRVDMMMDGNRELAVLEVNTIPGMTERSLFPKAAAVSGISFQKLCIKLIKLALTGKTKKEEGAGC